MTNTEAAKRVRTVGHSGFGRVGIICAISLAFATAGWVSAEWYRRSCVEKWEERTEWSRDARFSSGSLVIAGGGSLPDEIRDCVVKLAKGADSKLVIIPATSLNQQFRKQYVQRWKEAGAGSVWVAATTDPETPEERKELEEQLAKATGVWLGGGDQDWLASRYVGTRVEELIHQVLERGGVVGGTSAGAAIMTRVMIAGGMDEAIPGNGFDLLKDCVIDQHFLFLNRITRLMRFMEQHPDRVAFGIDEGTALVVGMKRQSLEVVGKSYVFAYVPPWKERPVRFEILKPRDRITLVQLRDENYRLESPAQLDGVFE